MPQFTHEGVIYEELSDGQVRVVGYDAAPNAVAPSPVRVAEKQAELEREASRDARSAGNEAADNARADRALKLREDLAALDAELKRAQITKAQGGGNTAGNRDRLSRLNQLVRQINRVQTLYDDSIGTTKGVAGVVDYLPLDDNKRFDAAGAALSQQGLAAFRVPGTGTVSDRDAIMFDRANLPTAATQDAAIEEQLLGLRARVEEELSSLGQTAPKWEGVDSQQAENELDKAAAFADPSPPDMPPAGQGGNDPGNGPQTLARGEGFLGLGGGTRRVSDDRANAMVNSLINAGADEATINSALKEMGLPPAPLGSVAKIKAWMRANPGKRYDAANVYSEVPLSFGERIAGSDIGAGLANYANSATAGTAAALAGERGKGALDAMQAVSPTASTIGSVLGGVTGALGAESLLAGRLAGTAAAKFAPRIADTGYGALFGFNEADEGQGLEGAALGGVTALGGGYLGEKVMRATGRGLRGVADPAVRAMRNAGVPMTAGQVLGGIVKSVEDRATSAPIIGDMIANRRTEGLQAFNRAAMNEAGSPIGARVNDIGTEGVQELFDQAGSAYDDATAGVRVPIDAQFERDFAPIAAKAANLPADLQTRFVQAMNNRVGPVADAGEMTGETYQQAIRGLKSYRSEMTKPGFEQDYRGLLGEAQDALTGNMMRGGGEDVVSGLRNADNAYRGIKTVEDAAMRADGAGYLFTPSQLQDALKKTNRKYPGSSPLTQLADAGQAVLPSRIPDSGTAGRTAQLVIPGLAGAGGGYAMGGTEGAATGTAGGATLAMLLALGGTKAGQKAITSALLERPEALRRSGEALTRKAQIGGSFGAGILTPLLVGS